MPSRVLVSIACFGLLAAGCPAWADDLAVLETPAGSITIRLLPEKAPRHVANFEKLAQAGFYDGTTFHRAIPGYILQGGSAASKDGDPKNDNFGHLDYTLKPEFNDVPHDRGVVSMARNPDDPESAGSQFFIVLGRARELDQIKFTVFGRVVDGMEVADKIASAPRDVDNHDRPLEPVIVKRVRIQGAPGSTTPPAIATLPAVAAKASATPTPAVAGVRPTPVVIPLGPGSTTPAAVAAPPAAGRVRTVSDNVNIREGPGADRTVLQKVRLGTILPTSGREGDWIKVDLAAGKPGYVRQDMVETAP